MAAVIGRSVLPDLPPLTSLEALLGFLRRQDPPRSVTDVVTQDEFTHDVVVRWSKDTVLVFDTT